MINTSTAPIPRQTQHTQPRPERLPALQRLGRLFSSQTPRPPEQKASASAAVLAVSGAHRPIWTPQDYAALARAGYEHNTIAHRCVRLVSDAAAAIPLRPAAPEAVPSALTALLERPSRLVNGADLLGSVYGYLQTAGNAYLELVCGPTGQPIELHALRPDRMRVVPGEDGWPEGYDYTIGARAHRFTLVHGEPSPILHLRSFHPTCDHYGHSPLAAASRAIDVHNAAASWAKALLDNAARPSGAVIVKGTEGQGHLSAVQYQRLREELESHHQGARNAGRPMLLEGGLDWKPMGFSPADMEFADTRNSAAREIALAFGVPPMLLGLPGDNTYSNYAEANRAFTRQTILPLVRRTACALSVWLSEAFGISLTLTPDLDALPALSFERDAQWDRISRAQFLSPAEKRRLLGLPEEPRKVEPRQVDPSQAHPSQDQRSQAHAHKEGS
ncbi:MAG: phage portal protein [Neomegalonema sp.]|nr:phage portal protein [Neomegalonema sp.]